MAEPKQLTFELRSPDKLWFSGDVNKVRFSTELGEMEMRPGHISVVGNIDFTKVHIESGDRVEEYFVRYGTMVIDYGGETARILAQDVQTESSMDMKSLSEYLTYLTERLANEDDLTSYQVEYFGEQKGILEKSIAILNETKR